MRTQLKFYLLIVASILVLTGCGGGSGGAGDNDTSSNNTLNTQNAYETAIENIYQYAQNDSNVMPTVEDYVNAGVVGVTEDNIDEVNAVVVGLSKEDVDTKEEIQAIVDALEINILPVANAGSDRTVEVSQSISITGSGSDSDGSIVSYQWKEGATLLANTASFTYTAPSSAGTHTLTLTVTDDDAAIDSNTMTVTVIAPAANQTPTANAGSDRTVEVSQSISITGSGSDSDGSIVSYQWKEGATLLANTASFTYTAPSSAGTHTLTLTVTDDDGDTASDSMQVTVTAAAANVAPTANAGSDRTVEVDQSITVTGSGSDSDGSIVSYQWKEGASVLANTASFTYTAPSSAGTHTLTLTVTDDDAAIDSNTMTVTVTAPAANQTPTANAGADRTVEVDQSITVTGSGSDSDGSIVSYQWKEGASVLANTASFTYTAPSSAGTHTLTLTVTDDDGDTASDSMQVTVTADSAIHITEDYQVERLGTATTISTTVSIDTGTAKDLYLVLSNYDASNAASVSISHSNKIVLEKSTKTVLATQKLENAHGIHPVPSYIQDFNNHIVTSPSLEVMNKSSKVILVKSNAVAGDTHTFYLDETSSGATTQATLRTTVSDISTEFGNKTLNIWVSDDSFDSGAGCSKAKCVTQSMVDALADTFLKTNDDNDIYDWVSNIFSEEWGSDANAIHNNLIAETNQIDILLTDIDNDNSTNGGVVGYFYSKDNYKTSSIDGSNERIMFYADAVLFANGDGTWEIDDFWPKEMVSTLAHEFQHMIHFYQKTVLRSGTGTDTWLNEMLSETVEEVIATKITHDGPRGVDYTDGSAGSSGNTHGRYPDFNENNTLSLTNWTGSLADYSKVNAFGAYLTRNYGTQVLHDIVHNDLIHEDAVEDAVHNAPNGSGKTFDDLLREWGIAVMLSDHTNLQDTPQYNTGDFTPDTYANSTYQLGSINFFYYSPQPTIYTSNGTVQPQGNYYYKIGEGLTGTITVDISLNGTTEATLIAK